MNDLHKLQPAAFFALLAILSAATTIFTARAAIEIRDDVREGLLSDAERTCTLYGSIDRAGLDATWSAEEIATIDALLKHLASAGITSDRYSFSSLPDLPLWVT